MNKSQISIPLEIADVKVLQTEINEQGNLIITIENTKSETRCHRCGRGIRMMYGHGYDQWIMIRYLPVFGRSRYLRYRPNGNSQRAKKVNTQNVDIIGKRTLKLDGEIPIHLLHNSDQVTGIHLQQVIMAFCERLSEN